MRQSVLIPALPALCLALVLSPVPANAAETDSTSTETTTTATTTTEPAESGPTAPQLPAVELPAAAPFQDVSSAHPFHREMTGTVRKTVCEGPA